MRLCNVFTLVSTALLAAGVASAQVETSGELKGTASDPRPTAADGSKNSFGLKPCPRPAKHP
jgi:hypothetical protein